MREIKFRAWNEDTKSMHSEVSIHNDEELNKFFTLFNHIKWMQYTGLKDKNGTEIYEGDVVKDHWTITVIEFNQDHCGFVRSIKGIFLGLENPSSLEVIGNIYENPELLK